MSQIYQHPSGGRLFQVGVSEIQPLVETRPIHLIIFNAAGIQPKGVFPSIAKVYVPFEDTTRLDVFEIADVLDKVERASDVACQYLSQGKNVISSCAAGLNRSGLTSALTLHKCSPLSKLEIVNRIRKYRHPSALSNILFLQMFLTS